jgi:hypothetical protein
VHDDVGALEIARDAPRLANVPIGAYVDRGVACRIVDRTVVHAQIEQHQLQRGILAPQPMRQVLAQKAASSRHHDAHHASVQPGVSFLSNLGKTTGPWRAPLA